MHLSKTPHCSDSWFTPALNHSDDTAPGPAHDQPFENDWVDDEAETLQPDEQFDSPGPPISSTTGGYSEAFPGAGARHGRGKTFMDVFDDDQFSSQRESNLFYPFASKSEWETASWLIRSGLSTHAIDEFFTLPLVSSHLLSS